MDMRYKNPSTASAKSNLFNRRLGLFCFIVSHFIVVSFRCVDWAFECAHCFYFILFFFISSFSFLFCSSVKCAFFFWDLVSFHAFILHFLLLFIYFLASTHFYYVLFGIRESFTDCERTAQSTIIMAEQLYKTTCNQNSLYSYVHFWRDVRAAIWLSTLSSQLYFHS